MNFGMIYFWFSVVALFYCCCKLIVDVALDRAPKYLNNLNEKYSGARLEQEKRMMYYVFFGVAAFIIALTSFCAIFMYITYFKR